MEGVDTALSKDVGMGGNQMIMTANMQMENRKMKMKNKKKRRRQSKNQLFNFSKTLKKVTFKKKIDSLKKAEEKEMQVREGQSNTEGVENIDQNTQKPKKPKLRNNRDFKFPSEKMELPPQLNQETEGRTSHRDERTLYVRFPPSLAVRDKSYLESLVPSAVDIRFPRLSPGSYAKFCYVEFETEEETIRMKENFADIKIEGDAFYADYVGKKSKAYNEKETRTVDPLRLYVGGLPKGIQAGDIRAVFPTTARMLYRKASHKVSVSHAYLIYDTHEEALSVFKASKGLKILGKEVTVMFATYKNTQTNKNDEQPKSSTAKKLKTEDVRMEDGDDGRKQMNEEFKDKKEDIEMIKQIQIT